MNRIFIITCLLFLHRFSDGQSFLKPSIGVNSMPQNTDAICPIPMYTGSFYTTGLSAGDTAFDFKLYTLNGDSVILSELLSTGKPVLLVNGNYTCPVFRNKVPMINQVASAYAGQVHVVVVYTVEAHPTNVSPYFGFINTTNQNINAGILFAQPTTYLERKNIVDSMMHHMNINVPVCIDGPCNPWWSVYGPAPNNAYLVKPDGIVFARHGWFDKNPIDYILCDIDSLLYNAACTPGSGAGNFSIQQLDTLVSGAPGNILYAFTDLINTSNTTITVSAKKLVKNYPASWQTAFCADLCYSTADDSITFTIAPYDTMHLSVDFITGVMPDSGAVKIGFRNVNNISNQFSVTVKAKTLAASSVTDRTIADRLSVYPNPVSNNLNISYSGNNMETLHAEIIDVTGHLVLKQELKSAHTVLSLVTIPDGLYYIRVGNHVQFIVKSTSRW